MYRTCVATSHKRKPDITHVMCFCLQLQSFGLFTFVII